MLDSFGSSSSSSAYVERSNRKPRCLSSSTYQSELDEQRCYQQQRVGDVAQIGLGSTITPKPSRSRKDFLLLVTLVCHFYRIHSEDTALVAVRSFNPRFEHRQGHGGQSVVSRRHIALTAPSRTRRGHFDSLDSEFILKRDNDLAFSSAYSRRLETELRIRYFRHLAHHPNIVKFIGVAWEPGSVDKDGYIVPRPLWIEERAQKGSLTEFVGKQDFRQMHARDQAEILLGIASGVQALHTCGIVHGDLKPDNILIFRQKGVQKSYTAKLTDFGFSEFEFDGKRPRRGHTNIFDAPESIEDEPMGLSNGLKAFRFEEMKQMDAYSLGMLTLYALLSPDSISVFVIVIVSAFEELTLTHEVDGLGQIPYDFSEVPAIRFDAIKSRKQQGLVSAVDALLASEHRGPGTDIDSAVSQKLIHHTLVHDPTCRSLARYVDTLLQSFGQKASLAPIGPTYESPPELLLNFDVLRNCAFSVKKYTVRELEKASRAPNTMRMPSSLWLLSACYFSGFGVPQDSEKVSELLTQAACNGSPQALIYYRKLQDSLGVQGQLSSQDLDPMVRDLVSKQPEALAELGLLGDIGSMAPQSLENEGDSSSSILARVKLKSKQPFSPANTARLLNEAAARGDLQGLQELLDDSGDLVNLRDENGDVPLISAARNKRGAVLRYLLHHSQCDASICNSQRESALTFVSNFDQNTAIEFALRLVELGASVQSEPYFRGSGNLSLVYRASHGCAMQRAIVKGQKMLLATLIGLAHIQTGSSCQVCKGSERANRMIAVAIVTQEHEVLRSLMEHIASSDRGSAKSDNNSSLQRSSPLKSFAFTFRNEPLTPWELLAYGYQSMVGEGLPERLCRAMRHGRDYIKNLKETWNLIYQFSALTIPQPNALATRGGSDLKGFLNSVRIAARNDNADFLKITLDKLKDLMTDPWTWLMESNIKANDWPLVVAIRYDSPGAFRELSPPREKIHAWKVSSKWLEDSSTIYYAEILLSHAVSTAHKNPFFVEYITQNYQLPKVCTKPDSFLQDRIGIQTSYLALSILHDSFDLAREIVESVPWSLDQRVLVRTDYDQPPMFIERTQDVLDRDSVFDPEFLDIKVHENVHVPLTEFILRFGSVRQCYFLLDTLQSIQTKKRRLHRPFFARIRRRVFQWSLFLRYRLWGYQSVASDLDLEGLLQVDPQENTDILTPFRDSSEDNADIGHIPQRHPDTIALPNMIPERWYGLRLDRKASDGLIMGLTKNIDKRKPMLTSLLPIILRDSSGWKYLKIAIFRKNLKIVDAFLKAGLPVNGPWWAYFATPLDLAIRLQLFEQVNADKEALRSIIELLKERGGRHSAFLHGRRLIPIVSVAYIILMLAAPVVWFCALVATAPGEASVFLKEWTMVFFYLPLLTIYPIGGPLFLLWMPNLIWGTPETLSSRANQWVRIAWYIDALCSLALWVHYWGIRFWGYPSDTRQLTTLLSFLSEAIFKAFLSISAQGVGNQAHISRNVARTVTSWFGDILVPKPLRRRRSTNVSVLIDEEISDFDFAGN